MPGVDPAAVLTSPEERRVRGEAGRGWVARHWSWEGSAHRLNVLLDPDRPLDAGTGDTAAAAPQLRPAPRPG